MKNGKALGTPFTLIPDLAKQLKAEADTHCLRVTCIQFPTRIKWENMGQQCLKILPFKASRNMGLL